MNTSRPVFVALAAVLILAACTQGVPSAAPAPVPTVAAPQPAAAAAPAAASPARAAEIGDTGCAGRSGEEPNAVSYRMAAQGTARIAVGERVVAKFLYEGKESFSDEFYKGPLAKQAGGPEVTPWTATLSTPVDDLLPQTMRATVVVLVYRADQSLRTDIGVELARKEIPCQGPKPVPPALTVNDVECILLDEDAFGLTYEVRASGTAFGPDGAKVALSVTTDDAPPPKPATPISLTSVWSAVGAVAPSGFQRDPNVRPPQPANTVWRYVARVSGLPKAASRNAVANAVMGFGDQQTGTVITAPSRAPPGIRRSCRTACGTASPFMPRNAIRSPAR